MPRLLVASLLISVVASLADAQPPAGTEALVALEAVWNDAHRNSDAEALDRLWAEDLEVTVPRMPPMSKAAALAFARSGRMRFERYASSEIRVRLFGDAALVSGRLERTRTLEGELRSDDWRFTKVYAKQDGTWRVVAFHASEARSSTELRGIP